MATVKSRDTVQVPVQVTDAKKHDEKMAAAREEKAAKQPELRKMLDPGYASEVEALKPRGQYKVSCILNQRSAGKMQGQSRSGVVTAQNEDQAWKKFCDQMKTWPSPKWCDRKIEKV